MPRSWLPNLLPMTPRRITLLVLGVLLAAGLLIQSLRLSRLHSELLESRAALARLQSETNPLPAPSTDTGETARLNEEIEALKTEVARLRGRLGEALRAQAATSRPGAADASTNATPRQPRGLAALTGGGLNRLVDSRMNLARERLNLTPAQEDAWRGVVSNAFQSGQESIRRLMAGEATYDEVPTLQEWTLALEKELLATLTPEQQAAYQEYRHQDNIANARLAANTEILLVQQNLGLDSSQQDAMFAVLYDQSLEQMTADAAALAQRPRDPVAALDWDAARKRAALEGILTPVQIENYQRLQDGYRNTVSRWLRPLSPRSNPGTPPSP